MNDELSQLPWDQLHHAAGGIPWPALHALADAAVTNGGVVQELFEVYDRAYERAFDQPTYADLYVSAILALAAPRLEDEQRRKIGALLLERLVQAGRDDADVSMEVLLAAVGAMGPVVLPAVLDAIANEPDADGAWFHLWGLMALVTKSEDEALRNRVVQVCVDLLEKVEHDKIGPSQGTHAAQTLASLKRDEYTDLLQRLSEKPMEHWWIGEYKEALQLLREGRLDYTPVPELWEEPVEKWFPPRHKMVKDWFAKRNKPPEASDEEGPNAERARTWALQFLLSPVARTLPAELREDAYTIAHSLLYHSLAQLERGPGTWNESILRELLLEIMPQRTPADRATLEKIAPVAEAMLYWLGFEGLLDRADALIALVRNWSDQIVAAGMDPQRWGPAKKAMMQAREAGLNVTEAEVVDAYPAPHAAESPSEEAPDQPPPTADVPPIPISEYSPKPARNAPCPCGSGKKYKKCHGRPGAEQATERA